MANTTATLTAELATFYVRTFLKNANNKFVFGLGAQKRTIPEGDGKTIHFSRYTPLPIDTTPLAEGDSGTSVDLSEVAVTATVAEYGKYSKISRLLSASSIDLKAKAKIELFRNNMLAVQDTLLRNELIANGTQQPIGTALTADAVQTAVQTLETKKAFKFDDGYFIGFVGPTQKKALMSDPNWLQPHQYRDTANIYKGEIGSLYGVRFLESSTIEDGATTTFNIVIVGKESFGSTDLEKDKPKLYINGAEVTVGGKDVPFRDGDKSDPLGRFCTIGWAGSFAAKILNPDWVVNISSTPTA